MPRYRQWEWDLPKEKPWVTKKQHVAHMVDDLRLCGVCLGWVDDPRHSKIGSPVRGVSFVLRLR